jgi:two-component system nitrate/nitrite response regulator NarL
MFMKNVQGVSDVFAVSSIEDGLCSVGESTNIGLILLDLGLPGMNGVEAVAYFRRKFPTAEIIVISASEERREVDAVLRAGAKVFISKAVSTTIIADIVEKILVGESPASTWITARNNAPAADDHLSALTPRQREALLCLCEGLSNKEIGLRMGLAEITVKMHVTSIFRTLGVFNRTKAVLAARRLGLDHGENVQSTAHT